MAGLTAQGCQLFWSTSTAVSTASSCLVGEVTDISGPSGSKGEIDVTGLGSSAKEYLLGLPDFGEISFNINYMAADVAQNNLFADYSLTVPVRRRGVIKLSDTAVHALMFKGYAKSFQWTMAKEDAIKAACSIRITGPATLTTTIA